MNIESVDKALSIIKPAEVRLTGWNKILPDVFNWEEKTLREVKALDLSVFIIDNPTKDDLSMLKKIDEKLTEIKKLTSDTQKDRKIHTKNFDDLTSRMMIPEKAYAEISKLVETTFIKLKRIENDERAKVEKRNSELASFRTKIQMELNEVQFHINNYIQAKVTDVYKEALELIEPEDIEKYKNDIIWKHTERAFNPPMSKITKEEQLDPEKLEIAKEIYATHDPKRFSDEFMSLMRSTFENFEIAKSQKEAAIKQREDEKAIAEQEIAEDKEMVNALAEIEEKATDVTPVLEKTRELKKVYAVDMEHNEANMIIIEKAFYANRKECLSLWQGKDCWKINTEDKGNLLAKIKNKDNNFEVSGVVFNEIEKI